LEVFGSLNVLSLVVQLILAFIENFQRKIEDVGLVFRFVLQLELKVLFILLYREFLLLLHLLANLELLLLSLREVALDLLQGIQSEIIRKQAVGVRKLIG